MSTFRPIVAVGMALARDHTNRQLTCDMGYLEQVLADFADGKISQVDAERVFVERAGTNKPVQRVAEILSVDEKPLPATNEKFFPTMHPGMRHANPRKKARAWTEKEDTRLLAAINKFGLDSWLEVTDFVGSGRTRAQCSQRWFRGLDPRISKYLWTREEEERLVELVKQFGDHSWTKVANALGNRSDAQCRYHYYQIVHQEDDAMATGGPILPSTLSVPASEMRKQQKELGVTKSMSRLSTKFTLPPITELIKGDDLTKGQLILAKLNIA